MDCKLNTLQNYTCKNLGKKKFAKKWIVAIIKIENYTQCEMIYFQKNHINIERWMKFGTYKYSIFVLTQNT